MKIHLGTSYVSFEVAREFARSLELKSWGEWLSYCKGETIKKSSLPNRIPKHVNVQYKDKGWKGMKDFLGIE